jgi:tetratricopeptide (TPR) repeat protein
LVLALAAGHDRFMVRPELLSFAGLTLTLLCLHRYKNGAIGRWIYALPVIQLLWCNAHTLWILGLAAQWIFVASEFAEGSLSRYLPGLFRRDDILSGRRLWVLFRVACLSSITALVTPYFLKGLKFPFLLFTEIGSEHLLGRVIQEFQSPISFLFFRWDYRTLGYLVVIAISAISFLLNLKRLSLGRLALWVAFLALSVKAQRNIALFGFIAAFATILNLTEYDNISKGRRMKVLLPRLAAGLVAVYTLLMIPLAASDYFYRGQRWPERFGFGLSDRKYPVRALEFMRSNELPTPVLHSLEDGGYILFKHGESSSYVDGRLEVYGTDVLEKALRHTLAGEELSEEASRTGAKTFLIGHKHNRLLMALEIDPDWIPVYFDHLHRIYLRITPETQDLVERLAFNWAEPREYKLERPREIAPKDWLEGWWPKVKDSFQMERLGTLFAGVGNYSKALEYFERAVKLNPRDERSCLFLGIFYRALGRDAEASKLLGRTSQEYLDQTDVNTLAGEIHLWAGKPAAAVEYFQRVIEREGFTLQHARRLARAAMHARRYDLAESSLRRMIELDPASTDAWNSFGLLMLLQNRQDEAIRNFKISIGIDPDQPEIQQKLDSLLEEQEP